MVEPELSKLSFENIDALTSAHATPPRATRACKRARARVAEDDDS